MKSKSYVKSEGKNPLTPITSDWMHTIMADFSLFNELVQEYGSPINLHHIPSFQENIVRFQDVFRRYDINGRIYFARKANKSKSLVKAALDFGIGVDTASYKELEQSINLGGNSENLVLTAAVKTSSMLKLAIQNNIPIIIDNHDELQLVQEVAKGLHRIANIGLRLSGFTVGGNKLYSRFGFDIERDRDQVKSWFTESSEFHNILLTGFHFHLDGYSIEQRAESILQTLNFIDELDASRSKITFLDIGGGILMNYLESKEEWHNFQARLQQAVMEKIPPVTFNNNGLGYEKVQNVNSIVGGLKTYPYYNEIHGAEFLDQILSYTTGSNVTVAECIKKRKIQLRIEPGRSLLNQVGLTIAKVAHRKQDANDAWLVGLQMNMSQLKSSSADFLVDPFIIYQNPTDNAKETELYFTGAYCLEQDVLLKRKLTFPMLPEIGDFVVFVNTGGYMMHFYETEAHLFELSQNLYILSNKERNGLEIYSDDFLPYSKVTRPMKSKAASMVHGNT